MEYGKFILAGDDRKIMAQIKNALLSGGHIFTGYTKEYSTLLRCIRQYEPDIIIVEAGNNFRELKQTLEFIDEELLSAIILIMDSRSDEAYNIIAKSHAMTYITKPIFDEVIQQIFDISLANYRRILDYEDRVRKLNSTLESRKTIEKAKWILVEKDGFTESEAYEALKKRSRDNRIPMRDIADAIILTRG